MNGVAPEYVSTGKAAEILGCHRDTILRYLELGKLTAVRPGGEKGWQRIRRADVEALLEPRGEDAL